MLFRPNFFHPFLYELLSFLPLLWRDIFYFHNCRKRNNPPASASKFLRSQDIHKKIGRTLWALFLLFGNHIGGR